MAERYEIHVNPGYGKSRFSRKELGDIGISMLVLAVAFTLIYRTQRDGSFLWYLDFQLGDTIKWIALFGVCLIVVVFSFLLHEFGHKFMAQKYGLWSEYRMYPMGLVLTLITAFIGFLFAAPGAVMINGMVDRKKNGIISIAGPAVNIVISAVCIAIMLLVQMTSGGWLHIDSIALPLYYVCMMLASLNAFLALFNLLPIPPLDGSKIIAWDKTVWVVAIAIAALEVAFMFLGDTSIGIRYSL